MRNAVVLSALLLAAARCSDPPPPPLCDGARPLALATYARGEPPTQDEVEQLVLRLVEVAGGVERLRNLRSKHVEDLYLVQTGDLQGNRMVATTWTRPDESVRTLLRYASGEDEERVMLRREEWLRPKHGTMALATGATQQHVEWDWEVARLPVNLLEAEELRPLRLEVVEGKTLIGLSVKLPGLNPPFEAWIDPAGPLLVEIRAILPITADLSFRTQADHRQRFGDWRRIDGILLAHRRETWVDGHRIGLGETSSWELDLEIPDSLLLTK
jgi:hypothetical protein